MSIRTIIVLKLLKTEFGMSLIYGLKNEHPHLKIMNPSDTLDYIEQKHCSIARFGDGEFDFIFRTKDEGYQIVSDELVESLCNVLASESERLLVCIPYALNNIWGKSYKSIQFWYYWCERDNHRKKLTELIKSYHGMDYVFGDTQISRPYIAWKNARNADRIFPRLKNLWIEKDVLIVEGVKTRMGVGNDLFAGAKSIKRVLCLATNAFSHYAEILEKVKELYRGELVILALGPTATVLAADLAEENIQALDIGHLDIEYEWYLSKAKEHTAVVGKYTNEATCGDAVDNCVNETYLSQIITRVAC